MFGLKSPAVAAGVILLLASTGHADPIIIDDFTDGPFSLSHAGNVGTTVTATQTGATSHIIGGTRVVDLTRDAGDAIFELCIPETSPGSGVGRGFLDFDAGNVATRGTLELIYDDNGAGLGGVDLTAGGSYLAICAVFAGSDIPSSLSVTLTDTNSTSWTESQSLTIGECIVLLDLATFSAQGVNTSLVDEIKITLVGATEGDYHIPVDARKVPEPATVILVATGLGAATLARRRRRR